NSPDLSVSQIFLSSYRQRRNFHKFLYIVSVVYFASFNDFLSSKSSCRNCCKSSTCCRRLCTSFFNSWIVLSLIAGGCIAIDGPDIAGAPDPKTLLASAALAHSTSPPVLRSPTASISL